MADRVYRKCPYCDEMIFFYDETENAKCSCGRIWRTEHKLIDVTNNKYDKVYPLNWAGESCKLDDGYQCYYLAKEIVTDICGNIFAIWKCICKEEIGEQCTPTKCTEKAEEYKEMT